MASNKLVAEVYRGADFYYEGEGGVPRLDRGGWRWRLRKGRNILADSGQGYSRRIDCIRGLEVVTESFYWPNVSALMRRSADVIPVRFL